MKTKLIVNVKLLDNRSVYEEEMEYAEFCVGKEYVWLGLDTIPISQVKEITVKFLHEEQTTAHSLGRELPI